MQKSETIGKLTAALIKAKRAFKPISKNKSISFGAGKPIHYADLQCMIEATESALGDAGLCIYQTVSPLPDYVIIETILAHESGEWMSSTVQMPLAKAARNASQEYGSVVTYARRYSYMGILCISPCDDVDASLIDAPAKKEAVISDVPTKTSPAPITHKQIAMLLNEGKICNDDITKLKRYADVQNFRDVPAEKLEFIKQFIKG